MTPIVSKSLHLGSVFVMVISLIIDIGMTAKMIAIGTWMLWVFFISLTNVRLINEHSIESYRLKVDQFSLEDLKQYMRGRSIASVYDKLIVFVETIIVMAVYSSMGFHETYYVISSVMILSSSLFYLVAREVALGYYMRIVKNKIVEMEK